MEQPLPDPSRRWDNIGTGLTGLVLGLGALGGLVGSSLLSEGRTMYADVGEESLPVVSKVAMKLNAFQAFDALFLAMLALGIFLLVTIKDRLRANLYGALVGIAMALCGGLLFFCGILPLIKIIINVGSQT